MNKLLRIGAAYLALLLAGCGGPPAPVMSLHPNPQESQPRTVSGTVHIKQTLDFEAVKSANMPVLQADGKLIVDKQLVWLRPPAQLIYEFLAMSWERGGGSLLEHQNDTNTLSTELQSCYFDLVRKKFVLEIKASINGATSYFSNEGSKDQIVSSTLECMDKVLEFADKHAKPLPKSAEQDETISKLEQVIAKDIVKTANLDMTPAAVPVIAA